MAFHTGLCSLSEAHACFACVARACAWQVRQRRVALPPRRAQGARPRAPPVLRFIGVARAPVVRRCRYITPNIVRFSGACCAGGLSEASHGRYVTVTRRLSGKCFSAHPGCHHLPTWRYPEAVQGCSSAVPVIESQPKLDRFWPTLQTPSYQP